jgi:hypothetical protein
MEVVDWLTLFGRRPNFLCLGSECDDETRPTFVYLTAVQKWTPRAWLARHVECGSAELAGVQLPSPNDAMIWNEVLL